MAKFGIALGSGPRGLGFESRYSDQKNSRFCSVKVAKTAVFIKTVFESAPKSALWFGSGLLSESGFDPNLTQTGDFS